MKPEEMTMLNRLAIVGQSGMGALTYRPEEHFSFEPQGYDLDDLALQCQKILNTEYSENWMSCICWEEPVEVPDLRL